MTNTTRVLVVMSEAKLMKSAKESTNSTCELSKLRLLHQEIMTNNRESKLAEKAAKDLKASICSRTNHHLNSRELTSRAEMMSELKGNVFNNSSKCSSNNSNNNSSDRQLVIPRELLRIGPSSNNKSKSKLKGLSKTLPIKRKEKLNLFVLVPLSALRINLNT